MESKPIKYFLISFYFFAAVGITVYLSMLLRKYPLTDWATNDLNWTREWLYMTVLDYYGLALALSIIVITSEPFPTGILWVLGFCLLGSPFACLYIVYRLAFKQIAMIDHLPIPYSRL